jgi:hypothetical protein
MVKRLAAVGLGLERGGRNLRQNEGSLQRGPNYRLGEEFSHVRTAEVIRIQV